MKTMRKLGALALSLVMVLALSVNALATENFNTGDGSSAGQAQGIGEIGGFTTGNKDTARVLEKSINMQKEIKVYNPDEAYVYGPEITYTYAIAAATGSELVTVTDAVTDHASGVATVTTVLAGVMTPTLTGTGANTIAWTNADILDASSAGASNIKNLTVDFSSIVFTQPGVYRYKITESATYTNTGVTDGGISNVRYLDVYVMRSAAFDSTHDGSSGHEYVAGDWSIYGYVCISPESVDNNAGGTTAVTPATTKTNGFVADATRSADQYYTYNFTVTKDLVGDNTMINHQFPLTVAFSGGPTGNFQLAAKASDTLSTLTKTGNAVSAPTVNGTELAANTIYAVGSSGALASFGNAGSPKVGDGNTSTGTTIGWIKYIGIPNTTVVTVTEQNDNVGTTYQASVKEDVTTDNGSALVAVGMTSTTGTMGTNGEVAVASIDNGETATRTAASNGVANALAKNIDVQFTNTLAIVSPTGLAFRFAPYALLLLGGIFLFFVARRREEEETA